MKVDTPQPKRNFWQTAAYRTSIVAAVWVVLVVVFGAIVTTTNAGDSVPDWPRSYGGWTPKMIGGVLYEHGHRLLAAGEVVLLTLLMIFTLKCRYSLGLKRLSVWAFLLIFVQAVLGGLRVRAMSDPSFQQFMFHATGTSDADTIRIGFGIAHAIAAQVVICLVFALALYLYPRKQKQPETAVDSTTARKNFKHSRVVVTLVFLQLIFGAAMRQSGAGLIVPDYPMIYGHGMPHLATVREDAVAYAQKYETYNVDQTNYGINTLSNMSDGELKFRVLIHFMHRTWAWIVLLAIIGSVMMAYRSKNIPKNLKKWAALLGGLVCLQVAMGILVILTKKSVHLTVTHVAVGALILGFSTIYSLKWKSVMYKEALA